MKKMSLRQKIFFSGLSLIVLSLVLFLTGEWAIRASGWGSPRHQELYEDTLLKGKPNAQYWELAEGRNRVILNNWGFHDWDRNPRSEKWRTLVLGDSFVAGMQVPTSDLMTTRLEEAFQEAGQSAEVINAGVPGANTPYEYMLWKKFFEDRIEVNQIILCIYLGNDLANNTKALHQLTGRPLLNYGIYFNEAGEIETHRLMVHPFQEFVRGLTRYSALLNFIYTRLYLLKQAGEKSALSDYLEGRKQDPGFREEREEAWEESKGWTLRLIDRWAGELKRQKIQFRVVLISAPPNQDEGKNLRAVLRFVSELEVWGERAGVPVLNMSFPDYRPEDIYTKRGKTYGHFNQTGHTVAAMKIYRWLKQDGKWPPSEKKDLV